MKKVMLLALAVLSASSCLFAQTTKNPFSELGYKKQVMYTSSKGEFEEFHGNPDVVEIGSVYLNTKTNKVVGYVNKEKENAEVPTATSAMSVDPLCEKYYWISPYAYCAGNPVRYIDVKGKWIADANGKPITFNSKTGWSSNATPDVIRVGNAMRGTPEGNSQLNSYFTASHPITLDISSQTIKTTDANGITSYKLGNTLPTYNNGTIKKAAVTIYEGSINSYLNDTKNSKDPAAQSYQNNTNTMDQAIAAVAGHEGTHATDKNNIKQVYDNQFNGTNNDVESVPVQNEMKILDQTGYKNLQPLPNPLSQPIPAQNITLPEIK